MSGLWSQFGAAVEQRTPDTGVSAAGIGTLTFFTAHGLRAGDIVILTGATPSGWDGTYVVQSVPSPATLTILTPTNPAAISVMPLIAGYGIAGVTPSRFWEYNNEGVKINPGRVKSSGLRAGARQVRSGRSIPYVIDATGPIEMDVMSKGFGFWLKQMLGSLSIATNTPVATVQTMTGQLGSLVGVSFCGQIGMPLTGAPGSGLATTVVPKNLYGAKVVGWELMCEKDGALKLKLDIDAQNGDYLGSVAVASYPTCEPLTFLGGAVTIGGTAVDATKVSVKGTNGLRTDGRKIRSSPLKKEPFVNAYTEITVAVDLDFASLTNQNRIFAATAAGTETTFGITFTGTTLLTGSTYPSLALSIPAVQWNGDSPVIGGPDIVPETLVGEALDTGASLITATYITLDTVA